VLGYFLETESHTPLDPNERLTGFNVVRPSRSGKGEMLVASRDSLRANTGGYVIHHG
jgi:hypothetical protein